jgi:hypothetical protein
MMPDAEIVFKAIRTNGKISIVVALLSNGRIRQAVAVRLLVMMMMKSRNATMMVNNIGDMPARARNALFTDIPLTMNGERTSSTIIVASKDLFSSAVIIIIYLLTSEVLSMQQVGKRHPEQ